jgi:hypothetical protein
MMPEGSRGSSNLQLSRVRHVTSREGTNLPSLSVATAIAWPVRVMNSTS